MRRKFVDKEASCSRKKRCVFDSDDGNDEVNDDSDSDAEFEYDTEDDDDVTILSSARRAQRIVNLFGPDSDDEDDDAVDQCTIPPSNQVTPTTSSLPEITIPKEGEPGYSRYPAHNWSLTITKTGKDVSAGDLEVLHLFFKYHCIRGGVALEVGPRAHNLHFQGVFETLYPKAPLDVKALNTFVKKLFVHKGKGHRFNIKPLALAQSFGTMCGYIMKDEGQTWFQYRVFNITQQLLHQGKMEHMSQLTAIDEGKVVLTSRNLFKEMFKFQKRSFDPCVPPMRYMLLYACQSKYYIPAADLIKSYSKMMCDEAESVWKICHDPVNTTLEDIDLIFYERRGFDKSRPFRYFIKNSQGHPEIYNTVLPAVVTQASSTSSQTAYDRIESILSQDRGSRAESKSIGTPMDDDFIPLDNEEPEGTKIKHFYDRNGSPTEDLLCPNTISEMMMIVKHRREGRIDIVEDHQLDIQPMELRVQKGSAVEHACIDIDLF